MITIEIPFRLPSLNEYINKCRNNRFGGAKYKKDIEARIMEHLPDIKIDKPVFISFHWYEQSRRRDKDNVAFAKKFLMDSMQKSGMLPNDNNQYILGFNDRFAYGNGDKVVIFIKESEEQ